jgi:peptide/nickel transport system substrate-binding protein
MILLYWKGGERTMKKKIMWVVVSCLMALSLVIASCGPKVVEEEKKEEEKAVVTTKEEEKVEEEVVTEKPGILPPEVPKYGGTLTLATPTDPTNFDDCRKGTAGGQASVYCYQRFMVEDWTRGPAGSGVTDLNAGGGAVEDYMLPQVAESWTLPEPGVWVLKIRQGIHWQLVDSDAGRLMNGRELTADDVVWSWNRHKNSPTSWLYVSQPNVAKTSTIEKTGPWEVTVRTPVEYWTSFLWVIYGAGSQRIHPREVVEKYGSVEDWRNVVGTGPFIFADYVPGSLVRLVRNPNYWEKDPVGTGKGNQVPYIDEVKELIIPDLSTQQAALRSGKIDTLLGVTREQWEVLMQQCPDLLYCRTLSNQPWVIGMRTNNPDLPYHDVRVRQALMLATDFETIKRDLYKGEAEIDVWPVNKTIAGLYKPLEEMPESVQELFVYNPEKAKTLLADAGYPDGFKAKVVVSSSAASIDELSIFVDMWDKVDVTLEMDVREPGGYFTIAMARRHEEMIYRSMFSTLSIQLFQSGWRGTSSFNSSFVNDPAGSIPLLEDIYNEMQTYIFTDTPRAYEAYKSAKSYLLEQAYYIPRPTPYTYNLWWPWLQNYYGQFYGEYARFYWIDEAMKKSMGY